jgi:curved DNA-binding protein CbpA
MAQVHTHYDNLKVARDAPPEVIRAAYKTLSQKHHPDRNGNSKEAIRIIQLINSAYEVLSDPVRRQEHDEWIARTERDSEPKSGHQASARDSARYRAPTPAAHRHAYEKRRSRRRPTPLSRLSQQAGAFWDKICRKLARKVFRKV